MAGIRFVSVLAVVMSLLTLTPMGGMAHAGDLKVDCFKNCIAKGDDVWSLDDFQKCTLQCAGSSPSAVRGGWNSCKQDCLNQGYACARACPKPDQACRDACFIKYKACWKECPRAEKP